MSRKRKQQVYMQRGGNCVQTAARHSEYIAEVPGGLAQSLRVPAAVARLFSVIIHKVLMFTFNALFIYVA